MSNGDATGSERYPQSCPDDEGCATLHSWQLGNRHGIVCGQYKNRRNLSTVFELDPALALPKGRWGQLFRCREVSGQTVAEWERGGL